MIDFGDVYLRKEAITSVKVYPDRKMAVKCDGDWFTFGPYSSVLITQLLNEIGDEEELDD